MTVSGHVATSLDPLASLAKQLGGSKRNALLKWCQNRTAKYTVCIGFAVAPQQNVFVCFYHHSVVVIQIQQLLAIGQHWRHMITSVL